MERKLATIDRTILEAAFTYNARDHRAYLDITSGQVIAVHGELLKDAALLRRLAADPGRFVRIDPVPPAEQHRWMNEFAESIQEPALRERLTRALDGAGAFRRFKDVLRTEAPARRRWYLLRSTLVCAYIDAWLQARGLTGPRPDAPAVAAAPELAARGDLRQLARERLERLSDDGLRLAIAYLRYRL